MNGAQRRHRAAVLLIVASVLWWHRWVPAFLVAGFVLWVILHGRLEGDLGEVLARVWRRVWPPRTAVLVLVLSGGTLAYWVSDEPITPKVLPIALNMLALWIISFGRWWTRFEARPRAADLPGAGNSFMPVAWIGTGNRREGEATAGMAGAERGDTIPAAAGEVAGASMRRRR